MFLGPHHCSKSVMYWQCEGDDGETLQQGLLDKIGAAARDDAYIVGSSPPIPASNKPGDNPPHAIAADRYRELVDDGHFLCTGEHPTEKAPEPIVFELGAEGVELSAAGGAAASRSSRLGEAVKTARGAAAPATQPVGLAARERHAWPAAGAATGPGDCGRSARRPRGHQDRRAQPEDRGDVRLDVSIDCSGFEHKDDGVSLRGRERLLLFVPAGFPFSKPEVWTRHDRWAGTPHVQWGSYLCLYQAPTVEWIPSDGMFGLLRSARTMAAQRGAR